MDFPHGSASRPRPIQLRIKQQSEVIRATHQECSLYLRGLPAPEYPLEGLVDDDLELGLDPLLKGTN